jgi:hypothetical protein
MPITHEDMQEIKKILDDRYVQIVDCDNTQNEMNKKFANDDKRIDRIMYLQEDTNSKLTKNNWLTITILGVILTAVLGMILKANGVF